MIQDLKRYPAYKDSGQPWLGDLPEHWEVRSLGSITTAISRRGRADLPLLSVVREKGVIARATMSDEENHNYVPDDLSNYKLARKGNLVINKMKAWQGSLGLAPMDGVVSPAYFVFHLQIDDLRFGQALLRSRPYVGFFAQLSDGVRIGQWDLSIQGMKRIPVVVPPSAEQSAIVRFLDHADRRIRRFIRAKQELIKLLEEQKQAIIHRAVTRGLDPDVRLKPSGIPWLGDIPERWEVRRLSSVAQFQPGKAHEQTVDPAGENVCVTARFVSTDGKSRKYCTKNFCPAMKNDVLMVMSDLPNGRALARAFYVDDDARYAVNQRVCIIRAHAMNPKFLAYSANRNVSLLRNDDGANQTHLSNGDFKTMPLVCPPREEQDLIVRMLDRETGAITITAEAADREIELLREYRTRLIADVVTGKLDVRAAAASLPDETEELEPVDADALTEDNVEADDSEFAAASEGVEV